MLKFFISYFQLDKEHMLWLEKALASLVMHKKISLWIDKEKLFPSEMFDKTISKEIHNADIVLLLLSNDFLVLEYIKEKKFPFIIEAFKTRGMIILPIVLKDTQNLTSHEKLSGILVAPFKDDKLIYIIKFKVNKGNT